MPTVSFTIRDVVDSYITTDYWINTTYIQTTDGAWMLRHAEIDRVVLWIADKGHVAQVPDIDVTKWLSALGYGYCRHERRVLVAASDPYSKDDYAPLIDLILKAAEDEAEWRNRDRPASVFDDDDRDYDAMKNGDKMPEHTSR